MPRNKVQSKARKAERLQKQVEQKIKERAELLREAALAVGFAATAAIYKHVHEKERLIEALNRKIRKLQTQANPTPAPTLWDFAAPEGKAKPSPKKGGR